MNNGLTQGYQEGYPVGYDNGTKDGIAQGYEKGYTIGYNNGAKTGTEQGYESGYLKGMTDGVGTGYQNGYGVGRTDGAKEGYLEGYDTGYINGTKDGAGTGYNIRDPTYGEMFTFMQNDNTDSHTYSSTYTCFNFCNDVIENAFNQGIKCGFVYILFSDGAHSIICFKTTDKGLIYIEPQTDQITIVTVGQIYQVTGYEPMDIVEYFAVVW